MFYLTDSKKIDWGMLRPAQPSQNIDISGLAVLFMFIEEFHFNI